MGISVKDARLSFGDLPVMNQLSLEIERGVFVTIIGPSGSGKSTLLKAMTGIHQLDSGSITVGNQEVTGLNSYFSYMPQQDMLLDHMTVYQNVTLYHKLNGMQVDRDQVADMLKRAGLDGYESYLPKQLSGGMRQRAAFIRTLLNPSDYLLLDEPLGALDAMTRSLMQDWLAGILADFDKTTVLVTHDIEEAIYLADEIILLSPRPASVQSTYTIDQPRHLRDRDWLASKGGLKNKIYQELQVSFSI